MTKYLLIALVALASLNLWQFRHNAVYSLQKNNEIQALQEALKTASKARQADQAALASASQKKGSIARQTASVRVSEEAAKAKNREWADQPLPKEVQDALPR